MGKLNINNGGVDTNKAMPNIDERYGPYNSFDEANAALGGSGRNVIVAGLKVGIRQSDGSVKEYFYQPNGKGQLELVASTGIPEQGAANDKVLGYENGKVAWVEKPVDGDDAYHVWLEANGYDEKDHPVSEYNEYNRGKSAREIYNATYNKNLNDAEFAAELKMNYPMLHVGYNESNAGETVGIPFDDTLDPTGENIVAGENTMGKLYLMPDAASDPENCIGFVTVLDDTYKWCNVGAIRIPSDVLAKSDVDNECINGTVDTPASAKVVMDLKAKLEGVTASETKANQTIEDSTKFENGSVSSGESTDAIAVINVVGKKKVRFLGLSLSSGSSAKNLCYGFFSSDDLSDNPLWYKKFDQGDSSVFKEYTIDVPEGATMFVTPIRRRGWNTYETRFYCYLQSGDTVKDCLDNTLKEVEKVSENIEATKELLYDYSEINADSTKNNVYLRYTNTFNYSSSYKTDIFNLSGLESSNLILHTTYDGNTNAGYYIGFSDQQQESWPTVTSGNTSRTITGNKGVMFKRDAGPYHVEIPIPEGAVYMYLSYANVETKPQILKRSEYTRIDNVESDIDVINESLKEYNKVLLPLSDVWATTDEYGNTVLNNPKKQCVDNSNNVLSSTKYQLYRFDIDDSSQEYKIDAELNKSGYYFVHYYDNNDTHIGRQHKSDAQKNSILANKKLTIPSGTSYILVNTKGVKPSIYYETQEYININERFKKLEDKIVNNNEPDYFAEDLVEIEKDIQNIFTKSDSNIDSYIFFTDLHYPRNNGMSGKAISHVLNHTSVNKAICGGDICGDNVTSAALDDTLEGTVSKMVSLHKDNMSHIRLTSKPLFEVKGNHDYSISKYSSGDSSNVGNIFQTKNIASVNILMSDIKDIISNGNGYYYFDITAKKLRYIFVDSTDTEGAFNDTTNSRKNGVSLQQQHWIANVVQNTPEGYGIIIISHHPVSLTISSESASSPSWINSLPSHPHTGIGELRNLIFAICNHQEDYSIPTKDNPSNSDYEHYNFENTNLILMHSGHTHRDGLVYNGAWMITSPCEFLIDSITRSIPYRVFNINVDQNVTNAQGTINEVVFDAVVIESNDNDSVINTVRIGTGTDKKFHIEHSEISAGGSKTFTSSLSGTLQWCVFDSDLRTVSDGKWVYVSNRAIVSDGTVTIDSGASQGDYVTLMCYSADDKCIECWGIKIV